MFNLKNLFSRALLALMLVAGSSAAFAGPTYHVSIDSTGYTGTGTIDFLLSSYVSSNGTAFVSNFTGNIIGQGEAMGDVSGDLGSGLLLGTRDGFGAFAQGLDLGQRFSFDVRFDTGSFDDGLGFSVGLFSDALDQYLGQTGTLIAIELTPGEPNLVLVDTTLASAAEVPEPATLAAMMLGLTLMSSTLGARRRK